MEKEHHHVHFGEDADAFGKDNEIVVQSAGDGRVTLHLGFLKVNHRYQIEVGIPGNMCGLSDISGLTESNSQTIPNVHCKLTKLSSDKNTVYMTFELSAYKEKLLKEELVIESSDKNSLLRVSIIARVLGKGKGTPLLRNGIHCIKIEDADDDSEASDWQGFE
ncbi:adipose-secreted signaling protein [Anabrus simplex]|uniref:adipose-secreted signaling protein n=1 Tax=Anabrus simplex TaxID=316456 RepID=UPI0034DDBE9F